MKSNTKKQIIEDYDKDDTVWYVRYGIISLMILLGMIFAFSCNSAYAQETKKKSDWQEVSVVEIPYSVEIHTGVTKNGNPKYWIEIQGTNVTVSENNYNKFINKEVKLVLVEWYNPTTDKYKYTTRQAEKAKSNNKLNTDNLW
jgi:hypothetical protein